MAVEDRLPIRDPDADVIKSGATKITTLSGVVGGLVGIDVAFNDSLVKIFNHDPSDGTKVTILVALIAAWALIAVADMLARALATAAAQPRVVVAPANLKVDRQELPKAKESDWIVAATRYDPTDSDKTKLLVVKSGETPVWVDSSDVSGA